MRNRVAVLLLGFLVACTAPLAAQNRGHLNRKHAWKQQEKLQKQLLKQHREYYKHLSKMEKARLKYMRKQEREYYRTLRKHGHRYPAYAQHVPHLSHAPVPPPPPRLRTGVHGRIGGYIEIVW